MKPLRLRPRALLLAAALAAPATAAAQQFAFPTLPANAQAGAGRVEVCAASGLPGSVHCGVFRVWEDRGRKAGRTLDIAFVVLQATDSSARVNDAVILLPGGPGQTFTNAAANIARAHAELRRTRDILLVDVRGTGRSDALDCNVAYPGGFRSRFGTIFPLDHARACRDELSKRANLALYTTASTVDDLDELRAWLGYPQLNLLGGSYGTRVAQVYMRRHPAAVRTAVLNGVAPIAELSYVTHALLLQQALDRVLADCTATEPCRTSYPNAAAELTQLLARFRSGADTVELRGEKVPFALGDLSYALRGLLYNRAQDVPRLVQRAATGDVQQLAEYYVERTAWVADRGGSAGYHFSVLCAEDIGPLTDDQVARATANTFMGAHFINGYRAVCNLWPYTRLPASHFTPVRSDVPTLLLSGGRDPVTPAEGGAAVAKYLTNAQHIVVPGAGHGVGGPCITRMIVKLIESASVKEIDTSCVPGFRSSALETSAVRFVLSPALVEDRR